MKAAQLMAYGGKDSVKVNDTVETPSADGDQVLVKVYAASINPFDLYIRDGMARNMKELEFPATLGGDIAGVIEAAGDQVSDLSVGDSVYGQAGALSGHGSFAQFAPVSAKSLAHKPASLDYVTSAAFPLVSVSAYQALVEHIQLQSGQKILIHGGGGGIGSMAVQLAKHIGAYVATTVSPADIEFVKGLGADEIFDYTTQDFSTSLKDFDAVFDTVGGDANTKSYGVLKSGGKFVSMVGQKNDQLVKEHQIEYFSQGTHVTSEKLQEIGKLIDENVLRVRIDKTFSLDEVPEALEYVKTGHPHGKVVIKVAD